MIEGGHMKQKKKLVMKRPMKILLVLLVVVLVAVLAPICYRNYYQGKLEKLGYSSKAIAGILKYGKQKDVLEIAYHKTLDQVFQSNHYEEKNFKKYQKIEGNETVSDLADPINKLLKKGYTTEEISAILRTGTESSIQDFTKREKEEDILLLLKYDWAKLENYDRYIAYQIESREDEENTVTYVNLGLDQPKEIVISEYSETVLANRYRKLGEDYVPDQLTKVKQEYWKEEGEPETLAKVAARAFEQMAKDASKEGCSLLVNSSYRSYEDQQKIFDLYERTYGTSYAENYVSRPGYSEHQTGLAIDVASGNGNVFKNTKEFEWMLENSYKYGFILRYPKEKEDVTGYHYEAWHYRYVGKEVAKKVQETGLSFDEYYIRYLEK